MSDSDEERRGAAPPIAAALSLDGTPEKVKDFYRDWAGTYDRDLESEGYPAPSFLAGFLRSPDVAGGLTIDVKDPGLSILDAGCGTGLVGVALMDHGYINLEGCDLSEEMAAEADRTGAYRAVQGGIDLCRPNTVYQDQRFDAVLSCGVFTLGHVPPSAMRELVRMTRSGGVIAVTTRKSYCEENNFEGECVAMADEGLVAHIHTREGPYVGDNGAYYWALRRL